MIKLKCVASGDDKKLKLFHVISERDEYRHSGYHVYVYEQTHVDPKLKKADQLIKLRMNRRNFVLLGDYRLDPARMETSRARQFKILEGVQYSPYFKAWELISDSTSYSFKSSMLEIWNLFCAKNCLEVSITKIVQ